MIKKKKKIILEYTNTTTLFKIEKSIFFLYYNFVKDDTIFISI